MIQLDLIEMLVERRRDAGMAIAQANCPDWFNLALLQIEQLRARRALGADFTFEDIVMALTPSIGAPPSKAIPGAVCMQAVRRKLIEPTGEYRKARGLQKNAHKNCVYRWRFDDA